MNKDMIILELPVTARDIGFVGLAIGRVLRVWVHRSGQHRGWVLDGNDPAFKDAWYLDGPLKGDSYVWPIVRAAYDELLKETPACPTT